MMTDVACFCGCFYSFDGGRGACPQCGEDVTLTTGSTLNDAGRRQEEQLAAGNDGAGRTGQAVRIPHQRTEAVPDFLAGIATGRPRRGTTARSE